jgi:hypothetical protein
MLAPANHPGAVAMRDLPTSTTFKEPVTFIYMVMAPFGQ